MKQVHVDFSNIQGVIKPLHGVNNGPESWMFTYDTSRWICNASVPYSRLHDTEGPYGAGHFVDVPCIFKDFDADVDDPASYSFKHTDRYLTSIKKAGEDIIYRLGVSAENGGWRDCPINIMPPKDYIKWAKICANIIRHYNEGWANGFHMNIQYWEIWNEPENPAMWTGTQEEFNHFYVVTSRYLKKEFPHLKIGGCGSMGFYPVTRADKPEFCEEPYATLMDKIRSFLQSVKDGGAPLDFFSWHLFSGDPEEFRLHAQTAKCLLKEYGFSETESILDAWNHEKLSCIPSLEGATTAAATLCVMQEAQVDIANYYDTHFSSPYNGLFGAKADLARFRRKTYYAIYAFGKLYRMGSWARTTCDSGVYACAAVKNGDASVMIVNCSDEDTEVQANIQGLLGGNVLVTSCLLDQEYNLEPVKQELAQGKCFALFNHLKAHSFVQLNFKTHP